MMCPKCHCAVYDGKCINPKCKFETNSQQDLLNKYKEVKTMENNEKAIPEEIVDLGETGIIDLPKFDPSVHITQRQVVRQRAFA